MNHRNNYLEFTQLSDPTIWECPIARKTEEECGKHPYAVTTLPGRDGHKYYFYTPDLATWLIRNKINPLTREIIFEVEFQKIMRRNQLIELFPDWNKEDELNINTLFSNLEADKSVLFRRIIPSKLLNYHEFKDVEPSKRRDQAERLLDSKSPGYWLIRKGSIKSVEKAVGTNTPADSYVISIKDEYGFIHIPFIHFFGYGFYIATTFSRNTDLTCTYPNLDTTENWYFTFGDLLNYPSFKNLDFTKTIICI